MYQLMVLHWGVVNAEFNIANTVTIDGSVSPLDGSAELPVIMGEGSLNGVKTMGSTKKLSGRSNLNKVMGRSKTC